MSTIRSPNDHVSAKRDLTGSVFGRLTVLQRADDYVSRQGKHYAKWLCRCDCGNQISVRGDALKRGGILSCGCLQKEVTSKRAKVENVTHGHSHNERLYGVWVNMRRRCSNPKRSDYPSYGGRGISVCEEWDKDYVAFRTWSLSHGYDENAAFGECTLDRIDVNGNYCPENCRWATVLEQGQNKRNNVLLEYQGETKTMTAWAREYGLNVQTLYRRIFKYHMSLEDALLTPSTKDGRAVKEKLNHGT